MWIFVAVPGESTWNGFSRVAAAGRPTTFSNKNNMWCNSCNTHCHAECYSRMVSTACHSEPLCGCLQVLSRYHHMFACNQESRSSTGWVHWDVSWNSSEDWGFRGLVRVFIKHDLFLRVSSQEMQDDEKVLGWVWNPEYLLCVVTCSEPWTPFRAPDKDRSPLANENLDLPGSQAQSPKSVQLESHFSGNPQVFFGAYPCTILHIIFNFNSWSPWQLSIAACSGQGFTQCVVLIAACDEKGKKYTSSVCRLTGPPDCFVVWTTREREVGTSDSPGKIVEFNQLFLPSPRLLECRLLTSASWASHGLNLGFFSVENEAQFECSQQVKLKPIVTTNPCWTDGCLAELRAQRTDHWNGHREDNEGRAINRSMSTIIS